MSSSRSRHQYGRSATTNLLTESSGDLLNRCSNYFSKLASRVRAASQTGEDRLPLSEGNTSVSCSSYSGAMSPSTTPQYPMLLKYSKYEDTSPGSSRNYKYSTHPKYNDYKSTSNMSDVKGTTSRYEDPDNWRYRPRYKPHSLAPSASFSSFSTFKSDYDNFKPNHHHHRYGSNSHDVTRNSGANKNSYDKYNSSNSVNSHNNNNNNNNKGRHLYHSSRTGDININSDDYTPKSYCNPGHVSPTLNYDKASSRYRPSRFLKTKLLANECNEEDECEDELTLLSKPSSKKSDYYSHYAPVSPSLSSKYADTQSPTFRRKHVEVRGGFRDPHITNKYNNLDNENPRESTASIMNRYSGLSNSYGGDTDSASNKSNTPDSILDETLRRKERAQLINMYSLPLDVLQNIGSTNNRKFRKRGKDQTSNVVENDVEITVPTVNSHCYDKVKQMAAQVGCFGTYNNADEEGSLGPPRKVLYGSASTGDMLSALNKNDNVKTSDESNPTKTNAPESEKYVLHEPPVVFEKAAIRDRPSRPTFLDLSDKAKSTISTCDNTPLESPVKTSKSLLSTTPLYSLGLLDSSDKPYLLSTPNNPNITVSKYLEQDSNSNNEPTFTTFKPQPMISPQGNEITYMPAAAPKLIPETVSVAVKPKTATLTTTTLTDIQSCKPKVDLSGPSGASTPADPASSHRSILQEKPSSSSSSKVKSTQQQPITVVPSRKVYNTNDLNNKSTKPTFSSFFGNEVSFFLLIY